MYSTSVDAYNRCGGLRNRNRLSLVYVSLGFRCEWCNKGWLLWWRMGISCK